MATNRVLVVAAVAGVAVVLGAVGVWAIWQSRRQTSTDAGSESKPTKDPKVQRASLDHLRMGQSDMEGPEEEPGAIEVKKVQGVKLKHTFVNSPVVETAAREQENEGSAPAAEATAGTEVDVVKKEEERQFPKAEPNRAQAALLKLWLKSQYDCWLT